MTGTLFGTAANGADIDGPYRYRLWRQWGTSLDDPICLFVMLNPSTADAERDDNTIACCRRIAMREGAGRLEVVNLYAWRTTRPSELPWGDEAVGPRNDEAIATAVHRAHLVIAAWGAVEAERVRRVTDIILGRTSVPLYCLARTKDGHPRHPRGVPAAKPLERWP